MTETDHPLSDDDAADEALADALADAWVARAEQDPAIRRITLRAAGLRKEPADMKLDELAAEWGTDRHTLNRIAKRALLKLRYTPEIQSLNPES